MFDEMFTFVFQRGDVRVSVKQRRQQSDFNQRRAHTPRHTGTHAPLPKLASVMEAFWGLESEALKSAAASFCGPSHFCFQTGTQIT